MHTASRPGILLTAGIAATTMALTGCGGGVSTGAGGTAGQSPATSPAGSSDAPSASPTAPATGVDPCSLLTDAEVRTFSPHVKAHKLEHPAAAISICAWPDAQGIPDVQLQVYPFTGSLEAELNSGLNAAGGYSVVPVSGVGDEAVAAYTTANPSLNITGGDLAMLEARSGDQVVALSVTYTKVTKGSATYQALTRAMTTALSRLP